MALQRGLGGRVVDPGWFRGLRRRFSNPTMLRKTIYQRGVEVKGCRLKLVVMMMEIARLGLGTLQHKGAQNRPIGFGRRGATCAPCVKGFIGIFSAVWIAFL